MNTPLSYTTLYGVKIEVLKVANDWWVAGNRYLRTDGEHWNDIAAGETAEEAFEKAKAICPPVETENQ